MFLRFILQPCGLEAFVVMKTGVVSLLCNISARCFGLPGYLPVIPPVQFLREQDQMEGAKIHPHVAIITMFSRIAHLQIILVLIWHMCMQPVGIPTFFIFISLI